MSPQDVADEMNAFLWAQHQNKRGSPKPTTLDHRFVSSYEAGRHWWPSKQYRAAFRHALRVETDAELGFTPKRRRRTKPRPPAQSPDTTASAMSNDIVRGTSTAIDATPGHARILDRETPGSGIAESGHALDVEVIAGSPNLSEGAASSMDGMSDGPGRDAVLLRLRLDGSEVVVPLSRRLLLQAGIGSFVEAFALGQQFDMLHDIMAQRSEVDRMVVTSPAHLREIVAHLHEQWHALVRTDNLLGPRYALAGVLNQIAVVEALRAVLRDKQRLEVVQLGAQYAESAAWLYEDTGNMAQARYWTSRAMEWAYEGDDERMLSWTIFRRSQQAAATPDAAQVVGLAQAARRREERLARPTRAAIRVQEAYGYALDGDERGSQRLLDEAHTWAASDTVGDAHEGHGSYCTPSYIEIQRATCWLTTGKPKTAIALYEEGLRALPAVYQRNRAAALSRLAVAYVADGQLEQAASTAHAALPVARSAGSTRIVDEIKGVSVELAPHRPLQGIAELLDDLGSGDA